MNHLVGITHDGKVGIVGYDENLSSLSGLFDAIYQDFGDSVVIKVALRLIDNEWNVVLVDQTGRTLAAAFPAHPVKA